MRWKTILIALSLVAFGVTLFCAVADYGAGGRPWYGWWDGNVRPSAAFVPALAAVVPGGAADRAGLRAGDRFDLREQTLAGRVAILYQLPASQPTELVVRRGPSTVRLNVTGSTWYEGPVLLKLATMLSFTLAGAWFSCCALLIALRRSDRPDGRLLALVLLSVAGTQLNPTFLVVPWPALQIALLAFSQTCTVASYLLLLRLASQFGARSPARTILNWAGVAVVGGLFVWDVRGTVGLSTLWYDPTPFVVRISPTHGFLWIACSLCVVATAVAAVATSARDERPRVAWTVLPLPIATLTWSVLLASQSFVLQSWFGIIAFAILGDATWLVGAGIVAYALLKRRVLDFEFVLSRTLVVGIVSAIVVASFALLEWLLGTVLAGASHATGLIANAALALVLGLSMNPLHKRVDALIEAIFFHKRRENERALLEFSKEAAYVTDAQALLDQAIERLRRHTDARGAALLLETGGAYAAARSFGETVADLVTENDSAILALKTWHRPLDPHHYESSMHGALAVPMLARGRLAGAIVLGERAGGEAYAPDEIEALSQFGHGVGAALDGLAARGDESIGDLRRALAAMANAIATLGDEMTSLKRSIAQ